MKTEKITFKHLYEWNDDGTWFQQSDIFYDEKNVGWERSYFPLNVFADSWHKVYPLQLFEKTEAAQLAKAFGAIAEPEPNHPNLFRVWFEGENRYDKFEAFLNR